MTDQTSILEDQLPVARRLNTRARKQKRKPVSHGPAPAIFEDCLSEQQLALETGKSARFWSRQRKARTGPPWFAVGQTIYYPRTGFQDWRSASVVNPVRSRKR
jgi:hypothetical protein